MFDLKLNTHTQTRMQSQAPPPPVNKTGFRLTLTQPEGCARESCTVFVGINTSTTDEGYLDITLEGAASGYVAVGFSDSANMVGIYLYVCLELSGTENN